MFGLDILDVLIGLAFVYLLLSLICTGINELIAGLLDRRAANLEEGIRNLLGSGTTLPARSGEATAASTVSLFYNHPLITSLREAGTKPSYIPAASFAAALTDLVAPASATGVRQAADLRAALGGLPPEHPLRRVLLSILDEAGDDLIRFRAGVENWFNQGMERVSAWYKQRTQWWVAAVALLVTVGLNADTIEIADTLGKNASLRKALVAQAQELAQKPPPQLAAGAAQGERAVSEIQASVDKLQGLGLPLGWHGQNGDFWYWFMKSTGLLVTTVAASLGAHFWFDMLNRLVSIRAVGKGETTRPPGK